MDKQTSRYQDHIGLWENELREWVPEKIFDAHTHIGPVGIMKKISPERAEKPLCFFTSFTIEELLFAYKNLYNGKKILNICAFGFPLMEVDIDAANRYVGDLLAVNNNIYGFLLTDPFNIDKTVDQFYYMKDSGILFSGIKPYFDFLGKPNIQTRTEEFVPTSLLEFMNKEKLVLMLHTSGEGMCEETNQKFIKNLTKNFPQIKVILAHMGRYVYPEQFFKFMDSGISELEQVFFDVSCAAVHSVYAKAFADKMMRKKLLFASDFPFGLITGIDKEWTFITRDDYIWSDPAIQAQFAQERSMLTYNTYHVIKAIKDNIESLSLSKEETLQLKEDIFFENALRVFDSKK
ncbi:amidohydrolase [bacterium]|nr:amidohydrolase [bacterium]